MNTLTSIRRILTTILGSSASFGPVNRNSHRPNTDLHLGLEWETYMKIHMIALSALMLAGAPAIADTVVAPGAAGNAQGPAPIRYFGSGGSRVQQIYSSNFFTGIQSISALSFRAYPGAVPGIFSNSISISDIIVRLSTTSAGDETGTLASSTFANNVGADVSTVFSGALTLTTAATGSGAQPFDYTITFATPFFYDSSSGNLLLDVNIPTAATVSGSGFGFLTFDTVNSFNDGIYSVVDINNGAATTGFANTAGAITSFTTSAVTAAVPEPASWALMIGGLGLAGMTLRRRSAKVSFA